MLHRCRQSKRNRKFLLVNIFYIAVLADHIDDLVFMNCFEHSSVICRRKFVTRSANALKLQALAKWEQHLFFMELLRLSTKLPAIFSIFLSLITFVVYYAALTIPLCTNSLTLAVYRGVTTPAAFSVQNVQKISFGCISIFEIFLIL